MAREEPIPVGKSPDEPKDRLGSRFGKVNSDGSVNLTADQQIRMEAVKASCESVSGLTFHVSDFQILARADNLVEYVNTGRVPSI